MPQLCRAPRAIRADERRQHLIDIARQLFGEQGFHSTGMAQIAKASAIGIGQIYRDFGGKEDIIAAIAETDLAAFLDEDGLCAAVRAGDRAAVRGWIGRFLDADEPLEKCRMMAEIHAEASRNARVAEINRSIDGRVRATLVAALTALAPDGRDAAEIGRLADLVMTLGMGLVNRRLTDPALDADALAATVNRIVDGEIDALHVDAAQAACAAPSSTSGSCSAATPSSSAASSRARSPASAAVIPNRAATSGA